MGFRTTGVLLAALAVTVAHGSRAAAQWTSARPDGHAPIGVMGDHGHEAGEIMLSYRFMYMNMDGSRIGTDGVTDASVIDPAGSGFLVTPTKMPMMMHMFGFMYAPVDRVTLMAMVPVRSLEMDHITRMGGTRDAPAFTTQSSGIGDIGLGALIKVADFGNQSVHLNAFVRIPTGSIEEMDVVPPTGVTADVQLPYPMQTGSGTFDLEPGITYLGQSGRFSWGIQARGTFRPGTNDRDYTLGDKLLGTVWGARHVGRNVSLSLRVEGQTIGDIEGQDSAPSVNPVAVPTARTDLRGGTRLDAGLGINTYIRGGPLKGLRFAAEALLPFYQDLDGPQLETDWVLIGGAQWAFF